MFAPFTLDEVESVRSIVLMGQQQDDMLLSNCSSRPLPQLRSFIRRFKRPLLDSQISVEEIAKGANEQYVGIIAGVRMKRNSHKIASAVSAANLVSPLLCSIQTVPMKFRSRYARVETGNEQAQGLPPPLPTRSRSVSELAEEALPVLPPVNAKIPWACQNISELTPGTLVAVLRKEGNGVVGRVLGTKVIGKESYALVAFFQPDMKPCYVRPQQLVKRRSESDRVLSQPFTVDRILESIMEESSSLVISVSPPASKDPLQEQQRKCVVYKSFACAMQLSLLSFAANYKVPEDKLRQMLHLTRTTNPVIYQSTLPYHQRCNELMEEILENLD